MRALIIAAALLLAACTVHDRPLPMVRASDPVVQLNPDRWTATVNDLITPSQSPPDPPTAMGRTYE